MKHEFPRHSELCQVLNKEDTTDKSNYRPIRTFSNLSKIFEKLIYNQVNSYMEPKLSNKNT